MNRVRIISPYSLLLFCAVVAMTSVSGCSNEPPPFCSLLALKDVANLHADVTTAEMEEWFSDTGHSTWYCTWKNAAGDNRLSLSVTFATDNSPYAILKTFSQGSRVVDVPGIGLDAAAMFYRDGTGRENRFTLFARNYKWTVDMRSGIPGNENSDRFDVAVELVRTVFSRLDTNETFSELRP